MELTTKLDNRLDMGDKVENNFRNGPVVSGFRSVWSSVVLDLRYTNISKESSWHCKFQCPCQWRLVF